MSNYRENAKVISQEMIAQDTYMLWLESENIAKEAKPGQFITLYCKNPVHLLPRPFGVCEVDIKKGHVCIVYRVVGEGTKEFSTYKPGDSVLVMGPLGNGFEIKEGKALLIGGGTGVPILAMLAKSLNKPSIVAGYRDETFLTKELSSYGKLYVATEDGSEGTKGNVIDAIVGNNIEADFIYACGPHPMLRAIKDYARNNNIPAWFSMEEKMACGIGACLACTCKSKDVDDNTKVKNKRICKEGPVFSSEEVEL